MIENTLIPVLSVLLSSLVAYYIANKVSNAEDKRAKSVLSSICLRFFINVFNACEQAEKKGEFEVKKDELSKLQYISELSSILDTLSALSSNPLFTKLIRDVPTFPKVVVQIRRELIEHETGQYFRLNQNSIIDFITLYDWLKKEGYEPLGDVGRECNMLVDQYRLLKK